LAPGESTELEITYQTYKYPGKFDKTVSVFAGLDGKDRTVIRLVGYVEAIPMGVIGMKPRKTNVGSLALDKENEIPVVIENTGDATLTVSQIVSTKFKQVYFDAEVEGEIVIAAGSQRTLKLIVNPTQTGRFLDTILIFSDARNDTGKGYRGLLSGEVR